MMRIHPALAGAVLAAALTVACSPSTSTPAADPSAAVPTFGAGDLPPGSHVQVARQGQWLPATIVQPLAEGRFLIHYDNTGNEWNEVVGPDRLKTGSPASDYKPGDKVLVTYQGRLLLADVALQAGADQWRVHYDGWGPEATEVVGPDRMRRPFAGASGHAVGEALVVDVNGSAMPAKVIAASAADRWVVRFDGFGPQYDQEVGADRIRTAPPVVAPPPAPPAPPPEPVAPPKPEKVEKAKPERPAAPEKPKPAVEAAPAPAAGPPGAGDTVLVSLRGAWFPATVSAPGAGGAFKVKFAGGAEEEVPAERLLREPASLKGLHYQVGQLVLVGYKGVYVPAKVLKQEGKADYKVRFEGTGPEEDEVVGGRRLRPR